MTQRNVYGEKLIECNQIKVTGWTRNGMCETHGDDYGTHIVCALMTSAFLNFTYQMGNDLITPTRSFKGLVPGDTWCICAMRWIEAYKASPKFAPPIIGEATHSKFLDYVDKRIVEQYLI